MENLSRPEPVRGIADRARDWIGWFGFARLIASAAAMSIVCVGAFWLVRTPPPPTEASLPLASAPVSTVSAPTLAPPEPSTNASTGAAIDAGTITVHVAGAVVAPGVYSLDAGSRVHMALARAGGVSADADPDALNLAAIVVDGSRVYVPSEGEVVPLAPAGETGGGTAALVPAGPIDINRATAAELDSLPGVGPATSTAIVTERERNGPFLTVDDLERVPGIGPAKLASLRDLVTA